MQSPTLIICAALAITAVAASSLNVRNKVVFNREPKCPADSASYAKLRRVQGCRDERTCLVECASASESNCSVMHRAQDSACYFGTAEQLGALFVQTGQPECASHIRISNLTSGIQEAGTTSGATDAPQMSSTTTPTAATLTTATPAATTPAATTPAATTPTTTTPTTATPTTTTPTTTTPTTTTPTTTTPTTTTPTTTTPTTTAPTTSTQAVLVPAGLNSSLFSKLLVLFDFRQGFSNLVDPSKYMARPNGSVTRDGRGAYFRGNTTDYIEVDTDAGALGSFLNTSKSFTFFARVVRGPYMYRQNYHYFIDDTWQFDRPSRFGDYNGKVSVTHQPSGNMAVNSVASSISTGDSVQLLTAAVVFSGGAVSNFYLNGSFLGIGSQDAWGPFMQPRYLRIGFDRESIYAMKGLVICYAIAKDALTLPELKNLEAFCSD